MADSDRDHLGAGGTSTTSFSQLLFSDDDSVVGIDMGHALHYTSSSTATGKPSKMICFEGFHHLQENQPDTNVHQRSEPTTSTLQKSSGVTCSDSSSTSSANNSSSKNVNVNTASRSNVKRKRNGTGQQPVQCTAAIARTALTNTRTCKKAKTENLISPTYPKVRKETLGERITALQQLVSPFGKTDTASVLHEAMGYIKFLQEQVQALCSLYLQHLPKSEENGEESRKDMSSRGLCLVPVEWTLQVASSNGADYWSPAMCNNFSPPLTTKHYQ
ncbi:hypothetical protein P3X46_013795 [Hevea brasiliensis]|uniref:BHLH domain-containing protein n=1 Tax=Hevea brasiliensis TaxID=3981 RepID=A0ABQ9M5R0_HEVBR|nr:transcription factor bHLH113 [Hevea brasiliensis]KAJ9175218.1 hypothetical protein P3X46_013795 [Hevea brasiliensis]